MFGWFKKKAPPELAAPQTPDYLHMTTPLPRQDLLRRGRIAILDDDVPEMLRDLQNRSLSVNHFRSTSDPGFQQLETTFYDILLLDYSGVGKDFGEDEGLDVLRHLKRVNPSLRILAFTSRTFDASKADFFRKTDGVIKKDSGIRETMEALETHLGEVLTPAHSWRALCSVLDVSPDGPEARQLAQQLGAAARTASASGKPIQLGIKAIARVGSVAIAEALAAKVVELSAAGIGDVVVDAIGGQ